MDKAIVVGLVVALLLGAVFVSAQFSESSTVEVNEPETPQPSCGSGTCNFECGGNCGIPTCGCGR